MYIRLTVDTLLLSGPRHIPQLCVQCVGRSEMSGQRLHLFTAVEVAEELTLRDAEMLRRITPEEISNGAWMDDKNVGQGFFLLLH